ncbi:MAG TPA: transferrin receptor-like dimerization domain-containing protein [Rhizomicrobium sp.]|jgi:N-acetylated-alpha-linked acidic dipeptidase|nr:transferrin receptor-like dimerization domain-containing protein [Rhizomicrobium sp.]
MLRTLLLAATALTCIVATSPTVDAANSEDAALFARLDASIQPNELRDWMKMLASEPNHVGSPHDKANAEWVLAQFKSWGWDAHIETFYALYPTPIHESLEMVSPRPFKAMLQEPPIPGDTSARATQAALPAYLAYQGDGDVKGELVYVNYGMKEDYDTLERLGVSVKGRIVIARYGHGWRGLKPRLALEHGAIGCIIYSDPQDDGYGDDAVYPAGPMRPPHGIQRGSVEGYQFSGDPLTPGVGATKDAKRLTVSESPVILRIPAIPISYADAQPLLASIGGQVAPESWRGALPITYHTGPGGEMVHLAIKSDWSLKPIYDVVATLHGSSLPDEWVVRGNHRDGWVFGASDPLSGQVALIAEAKALGALAAQGWKPKRSIVYTSWDGEEAGLIGSTEWAETHADELKQKAVLYINTDGNARGILAIEGSQDFEALADAVTKSVTDPEKNVSVGERMRAHLRLGAFDSHSEDKDHAKAVAAFAADPARDLPIAALGSGSDYGSFIMHLGIPALDFAYGDEGKAGGVYHSRYDTFEHHSRFVDPGFVYDSLLAKTIGRTVLMAADSDLPLQRASDFAGEVAQYLKEVKKLANDQREKAGKQAALLKANVFALNADPTKPFGDPAALKPVPPFDFTPLDSAVARLTKSATAYDDALAAHGSSLSADRLAKLQSLMQNIDQTLTADVGLPGRPWFKNLIYAPGTLTGYGTKTLPAVREGIEQERFDEAARYIPLTANVLNAYSDRLDQASAVLGEAQQAAR